MGTTYPDNVLSSDTDSIVRDLNAGWRNYVCDAMNLDRHTFQLAQGSLGLQTTNSSGLFIMADGVPRATTVDYYDASSMNRRSDNYSSLLVALRPEISPEAVQDALGDGYASWVAFNEKDPKQPGDTVLIRFKRFALTSSLDPGTLARGEAAILASANAPNARAQAAFADSSNWQSFVNSAGKTFTLPIYTATVEAARSQINQGSSVSLNFDSNSMDTSASGLFVEGAASGFYDIFSAKAGASFQQQNRKAASARLTVTGTINRMATLPSAAGGWYSSGQVTRAFNGKGDAQIWDPNASTGGWDNFFGPNGGLARYVSQLVLVSDYTITTTSHATYSQDDFQQIKTHADVGVWPFFSASESSTQTTTYTLNKDSSLSVTHTLGKGLIQIWGVTVQPAP